MSATSPNIYIYAMNLTKETKQKKTKQALRIELHTHYDNSISNSARMLATQIGGFLAGAQLFANLHLQEVTNELGTVCCRRHTESTSPFHHWAEHPDYIRK